ncbi:phosphate transport system regulatory protein PhoU [Tyzzerella sp. An114]|uniref:phosphate signaling complex protein PhoU n=1 Tax=Tyzzerella sp. An114 TaxID=1965545 RepID=UPI000B44BF70|nr:phosphate signaling complex protein PhoU [Tyzzerella sp. An114]OUQ60109.1 phosphate transport system regulatory protein PhoU [Tyzzerella sp. An114]
MRNEFQNRLCELHKEIMKMNTTIEKTMDMLIEGMEKRDRAILDEVIERDNIVDNLEADIEKMCISLILREQPVAFDLRNVTSILKIITDLERIADHCTDIAKYLIEIIDSSDKYLFDTKDISNMSFIVKEMITSTTECYIKSDEIKARDISLSDDKVDAYFTDIVTSIESIMERDSSKIFQGVRFLYIVKYLERIADHSTNICEWIIYRVTGEHIQYN